MEESLTARFLAQTRIDLGKDFDFVQDTEIQGKAVPLFASFDVEGERKTFGIMPTGSFTHCHEYCVFIPVGGVSEAVLTDMLEYITQVHDEMVKPDGKHEFSLVSLVLLTDKLPERKVQKILKKFTMERTYTGAKTGWSLIRAAIVALEEHKVLVNRLGAPLGSRLTATLNAL